MLTITLHAKQKKRHRCIEQTLDSVGEGEGGMFQENSFETWILSRMKQITSPGWMHETSILFFIICVLVLLFFEFILQILQTLFNLYSILVRLVLLLFYSYKSGFCLFVCFNKIDHSIFSKSLHINLYNIKVVISLL